MHLLVASLLEARENPHHLHLGWGSDLHRLDKLHFGATKRGPGKQRGSEPRQHMVLARGYAAAAPTPGKVLNKNRRVENKKYYLYTVLSAADEGATVLNQTMIVCYVEDKTIKQCNEQENVKRMNTKSNSQAVAILLGMFYIVA